MKTMISRILAALVAATLLQGIAAAGDDDHNVRLHLSSRWKECSLQLDPSLTQEAWHEFTEEAGLVAYFRPLTGARSMGAGNFEFSLVQWKTRIDDEKAAWNDTFVHPDSTHWLHEGSGLAFPGLMMRAGVADRLDVGIYWTKNMAANYGFWGGQLQYAVIDDPVNGWAASARASMVTLYGPDDLDLTVYGMDLVTSRTIPVHDDWVTVTPYAGLSGYLSRAHEKTAAVDLRDEDVFGGQSMIGAEVRVAPVRLGVEFSHSKVNSLSLRLGVGF